MMKGRWKLIEFATASNESDALQLYDLRSDPYESRDLSGEKPAMVRDLYGDLGRWKETKVDDNAFRERCIYAPPDAARANFSEFRDNGNIDGHSVVSVAVRSHDAGYISSGRSIDHFSNFASCMVVAVVAMGNLFL
mmetsp:Transcript_25129/g.58093  ORF Transcript_25129/g.58093 Transcript_25129/m.58093 type:complete len:136 (-) Transcript_25129:373-780(-)